ncbi:transketolase [Magnetococcus marinus MC-1]|uniref:Transketolase n=1 Tax=Magnetococcus marinus (strain ATCC BAA-1437 / JCM 17883 / MC-1) TaxID=156889 RepID=A0LDC1_MAGMM|nr:transketolase [Magnetococcus marinus]ABK45964.1 transketolase [Magnetococcus marinus MC-1]
MSTSDLDRLCINTLRMLSVDAIEAANSGHPGLPLGAAPMAYVLWSRIMRHNPKNPLWPDRDRFILSAGHGSALLYALLHTSGYDVSLDELKNFRQYGSKTPGHPEYGHTPGVECTTGPLGQGFAMGVGMALAERHLAQQVNRAEFHPIVDHFTYGIVGDGDLMEGITYEAAAMAGNLCLGKLIYLYDDNGISIEGSTEIAFTEDVTTRFEAAEWQVLTVEDGEDLDAIEAAILQAQQEEERPSLIRVKTVIGRGSPKQGTAATHGSPIKGADMVATRQVYAWPETRFYLPDEAQSHFAQMVKRGAEAEAEWNATREIYMSRFPTETELLLERLAGELTDGWDRSLDELTFAPSAATRSTSGQCLNAIAQDLPGLIGGSADLGPSNNTTLKHFPERTLHFGVREHAMGAVLNGLALHGGFHPYGGTFLVFSDYLRGAIRLSALMHLPVTYVLTHDSIGVGEDGPTHQPVEHVASLRAIPGLNVFRPCDGEETRAAWHWTLCHKAPAAMILTRQELPELGGGEGVMEGVARGGYIKVDCQGTPDLILLASGSEVSLAVAAAAQLSAKGHQVRVVSMPCMERFDVQDAAYKESVLPAAVATRLAVEAGSTMSWYKYVGLEGEVIGLDNFGASGPGDTLMEVYGFTTENVVAQAQELLG